MKINKTLALLVVVSVACVGSSYGLESFDFSYTFATGDQVTGVLWGTPDANPNYVDNVTVQSIFFNGSPFLGTVIAQQENTSLPFAVSYTITANNFYFGDAAGNEWLYMKPSSVAGSERVNAKFFGLGDSELNSNNSNGSWLTPDGTVPDGACTTMLLGMSLAALGWLAPCSQ